MKWDSASAFFEMGGYGLYVWGSYVVAVLLMSVEPVLVRRRHRRSLRDAARLNLENEAES
jgi:heme exporter protein D